jgi:hypothetical protein
MKLSLHFGMAEPPREANWWQPVTSFPTLILYKGKKWEFVMWKEDPAKKVDYILYFSPVATYDPNWHATTYESVDGYLIMGFGPQCECGSIYTSFPQFHMFFCPKWSKF